MTTKILSVDDSKAIRIIVKKVFSDYDTCIIEASNGAEGLEMVKNENPDIILLDVTMPIMDGIEMLTKLKTNAQLQSTPVIMLTAEASREQVIKIAKLGVRDYIIKPFDETILVKKVARIVNLSPKSNKSKSPNTNYDILFVDDKTNILEQVQEGLAHTPWTIHMATCEDEALQFCNTHSPDLVVVSLSLPNGSAITTLRALRAHKKLNQIPIFGLSVKTATDEQNQAKEAGYATIITKPINFEDLEHKISKSLNLDLSLKYFNVRNNILVIEISDSMDNATLDKIATRMNNQLAQAVDNGINNVIIDAHHRTLFDVNTMKLFLNCMNICGTLTLRLAIIGNNHLSQEAQNFEESKFWTFHPNFEDASAFLIKQS